MDAAATACAQGPAWRWEMARAMVESPEQPFRPCSDAAVRIAQQFWSRWRQCRCAADRQRVALHMPTMARTFAITQEGQRPLRHALEARVLAAEAPRSIANKNALPLAVVQCFEEVYWDVRGYLGSPDYIRTQVLGPRLHAPGMRWSYDLVWAFFGYIGGPRVLDELMHAVGPGTKPQSFADLEVFLTTTARTALQKNLAIAAHALMPEDERTATELLRLHAQMRRGEDHDESGTAQNQLSRHVAAMLQEFPWTVGTEGEARLPPIVAAFDRGAVELRDEELLMSSAGEEPPGLAALKDLKLPEPSRRTGGARAGEQHPFAE